MTLKKIKKETEESGAGSSAIVKNYSLYKGKPMVRIAGNFFSGGFNLSQKKVQAVINNLDELKKFANGDYDKEIKALTEDEILEVE